MFKLKLSSEKNDIRTIMPIIGLSTIKIKRQFRPVIGIGLLLDIQELDFT